MRPPAPLVIISALLLCCAGFCSRANSQIKPAKKNDATVSGKVTIKGKPAPGVVVGMRSSQPAQFDPTFKATTDQEGNYRVTDLPAGSYEVAPVAPAFVISDANNSRGQTVIITESENVESIDFDLARGGVITGKVTDADGSPIVAQRVNLLPVDQRNQRRPDPFSVGFQTDDRGVYRVFGVPPGHYKVSIGQGDNNLNGRGRPAYPTTFYPDAADSSKATVIEIDEGTEATKIDITLSRQTEQGFSVSGRVVDESGKPVANVDIELSRIIVTDHGSSSSGGGTGSRSDSRGEFRLEKLPPGKYSISGYLPEESGTRAEPVSFDVLDQDLTGLVIKASKGASVLGVVVIEGAKDSSVMAALSQSYISAYVRNEGLQSESSQSARVKPDGSFRISGLHAGIANFSLYTPGKWLTISRTERDGVVQSNGIQIQNAEEITGIRAIVAYHNGSIRGVVKVENGTLPSGARFFVQLTKPDGGSPANLPSAPADSRGHFLIEGLAAGNYELLIMAYASELRQRAPSVKQAVSVTEGAVTEVIVTIDLTPTPNP